MDDAEIPNVLCSPCWPIPRVPWRTLPGAARNRHHQAYIQRKKETTEATYISSRE